MATLTVKKATGADAGTVEVTDTLFAVEPNKNAMRQALLAYEANQRAGTHSTKTRAFVSGGGRKPYKQKGTGRARQGSIRATQWRGGAIVFGPQPRDYNQKLNKKVKRLALASALTGLRNDNRIVVVDDVAFDAPKTKQFVDFLDNVGASDARRVLVLVPEPADKLLLSARNLPHVLVSPVNNVNIYSLMTCDYLVTTQDGIKKLEEALSE